METEQTRLDEMKNKELKFDKNIDEAIDFLQGYLNTYKNQESYKNYRVDTFVHDILYGLGVSISEDHGFANGYRDFKEKLIKFLEKYEG